MGLRDGRTSVGVGSGSGSQWSEGRDGDGSDRGIVKIEVV